MVSAKAVLSYGVLLPAVMPIMKKQASHQEDKEQEFGDSRRGHSDARESKHRCHQCDNQKNYSPPQHIFTSSQNESDHPTTARVS